MKHMIAAAILCLAAGIAKADSYVSVDMLPFTFTELAIPHGAYGSETIGVDFTWDTTTNVLSNFAVYQSGPFITGTLAPEYTLFGTNEFDASGLTLLDLSDGLGGFFQEDTELHGLYVIGSTPGTYTTDLYMRCAGCVSDAYGEGTAVVSAIGNPTTTPEPATLVLLLFGLLLAALWRLA